MVFNGCCLNMINRLVVWLSILFVVIGCGKDTNDNVGVKTENDPVFQANQELMKCIDIGTYDAACIRSCLERGAFVDIRIKGYMTPLTEAAERGDVELVKYILSLKPDVNFIDDYGNSILMNIAGSKKLEVAQLLIDHGADVNYNSGGENMMTAAARSNNLDMAKLMIKNGFNVKEYGGAALGLAAGNQNVQIVKLLIENGADVNYYKRYMPQKTPLDVAIEVGNKEIIEILKSAGAMSAPEVEIERGIIPEE